MQFLDAVLQGGSFFRQEKFASVHVLQLQQRLLFVHAAGVSRETAARAYHPVAGDDQRNGIVSHRAAHGLSRQGFAPFFPGEPAGQFAVSGGLPVGNLQQQLPDRLLKGRACGMQRRGKIGSRAAEIEIQPMLCLKKRRGFPVRPFLGQAFREIFCAVEPQPGQTGFVGGQQNPAQGRIVMLFCLIIPRDLSLFIKISIEKCSFLPLGGFPKGEKSVIIEKERMFVYKGAGA